MQLEDAITDYLNHIRHEKGLAKTTCIGYTSWLNHFMAWLGENGYPAPTVQEVLTIVLVGELCQVRRERAWTPAFAG